MHDIIIQYDHLKNSKNTRALAKWHPPELLNLTSFLPIETLVYIRIWHLRNNIMHRPLCENCECPTQFDRTNMNYRLFCGRKCAACDPRTKKKKADSVERIYGDSAYFRTEDYKNKAKSTSLSRYGVEQPAASPIVRAKIEETNLSKYGVKSTLSDPNVQDKIRTTLLEKYNVTNPMFDPEIYNRAIEHTKQAYSDPSRLLEILTKRVETNLNRYGRYDPAQMHLSMENIDLSYNSEWLIEQNIQYPICYIAKGLGMGTSQLCVRFAKLGIVPKKHNISTQHLEVINYLKSKYSGLISINDHSILHRLELDIVLPELQLAIEIDGIYWHSEIAGGKSPDYHLMKTQKCQNKGFELIHIWETDNLDIVKFKLDNLLGLSKVIDAKKLVVEKITDEQASDLHNQNNLNGYIQSDEHYALVLDGTIYMCVSILRHDSYIELTRISSLNGYEIQDGLIKLVNAISSNLKIITYVDLRWPEKLIGFTHVMNTIPEYWDICVQSDSFDRIWDCGYALWEHSPS